MNRQLLSIKLFSELIVYKVVHATNYAEIKKWEKLRSKLHNHAYIILE